MNIKIVDFLPEHAKAAAQIEQQCFSAPWSETAILDSYNTNTVFFMAFDSAIPIGYCGMQHVIDEGFVTNVAVLPEYRKNGVGKNLINRLVEYAKKQQLISVSLEVRESNSIARHLYSTFGFLDVGRRKNFYSKPIEDAIIMTLTL
ncbi:MAG: ribosomal protein S18-alanine N-acetyltransferase [bacterium]|nr:ribosomal protein S18-alanine N-acetyltransferase [bacterium]